MNTEPNDPIFVDPNTDDLDLFSDLIGGKAKPSEPKETENEDQPEEILLEKNDDTDEGDTKDESDDSVDEQNDEDKEPKEKPKKVNRVQERINQLVTERENEKREKLELQRRLEALENAKKDEITKAPAAVTVPDTGPDPDAKNEDGSDKYPLGEFDPAYIRDMARHTIDKEWAARKEQEAKEQAERQTQEARDMLQNQWVEKLTPALEQYDDFMEKTVELESTFSGLDPNYSDYLAQTIKSLDHGPEVLYYFANNLEEARKFVNLGPLNATLALGEINAMFKGNSRKETKVSKAPPPPQANKGAKMRTTIEPDTDDLDSFEKLLFNKKRRS